MKHIHLLIISLLSLLLGISATAQANRTPAPSSVGPQAANGTAFIYQGRLTDGGAAANGAYDFRFILYDAAVGGAQIGSIVSKDDVVVSAGLFTATLDFGGVFNGTALFLDIAVRPGASSGLYTTLSPRQALTPAPYAHYATTAGSAMPFLASVSRARAFFLLPRRSCE